MLLWQKILPLLLISQVYAIPGVSHIKSSVISDTATQKNSEISQTTTTSCANTLQCDDHDLTARGSSGNRADTSRYPKGPVVSTLDKRQDEIVTRIRLKWHYTCPLSLAFTANLDFRVYYNPETNHVEITSGLGVQGILHQWEYGIQPRIFGGRLFGRKCQTYRGVCAVCDYQYHGFIEGQAWPYLITAQFLQNVEDPHYSPSVHEHCRHVYSTTYIGPPVLCETHSVEVIRVP